MAQKVIEGVHWHMTAFAFEIEMAQNSNHPFFFYFLFERGITCHFASNSISLRILSHLNFFELKKVSHFGKKTRDLYFEEKIKEKWMVRILSHLDFNCKVCHVTWRPSMTFWAISPYPPYLISSVALSIIYGKFIIQIVWKHCLRAGQFRVRREIRCFKN